VTRTRTPQRILDTALELFNRDGEPNVTTNRIADELGISPGNLHYHFRTKQSLVEALFRTFERRMLELLGGDAVEHADVEDAWLFLHLVFETIAEFRFIYRDLNELCGRDRDIRRRFRGILKLSMQSAADLLQALERAGDCEPGTARNEPVIRNLVLVSSYWLSFDQVLEPRNEPRPGRAAVQVMSIVSPYLRGAAREQFDMLAAAYRD